MWVLRSFSGRGMSLPNLEWWQWWCCDFWDRGACQNRGIEFWYWMTCVLVIVMLTVITNQPENVFWLKPNSISFFSCLYYQSKCTWCQKLFWRWWLGNPGSFHLKSPPSSVCGFQSLQTFWLHVGKRVRKPTRFLSVLEATDLTSICLEQHGHSHLQERLGLYIYIYEKFIFVHTLVVSAKVYKLCIAVE